MLREVIKSIIPQSVMNEIRIRRDKSFPINQTSEQREEGVKDKKALDVQDLRNELKEWLNPKNLDKMIELAKKISKEFPFVRVDFFEIEDKVYFSELTFYPGGGLNVIKPKKIAEEWGEYINLPVR